MNEKFIAVLTMTPEGKDVHTSIRTWEVDTAVPESLHVVRQFIARMDSVNKPIIKGEKE